MTETQEYLDRERRLLAKIAKSSAESAENTRPKLERSKMSIKQKAAYISEHGMAKYLDLPMTAR